MTRRVKSATPRAELRSETLCRLIGIVSGDAMRWGLPPVDAIYVLEGAADRIRREAEQAKRKERGR